MSQTARRPMTPPLKKLLMAILLCAFVTASQVAKADPVADFFRRIGDSISHAGKRPAPRRTTRKTVTNKKTGKQEEVIQEAEAEPQPQPSPVMTTPSPPPTPQPVVVRRGSSASPAARGDLPYAVPVPNRPGFVTSPYAPGQGLVDIRGIPAGTEVKDPFTGKFFLTP